MYFLIAFLSSLLILQACQSKRPEQPKKSQLEMRQIQTRVYEIDDAKRVMKSVLQVLQEEDYVVKNVAMDLGFLNATKEINIESNNARFWSKLQRSEEARWPTYEAIQATVNVTEYDKGVRVRANFHSKITDNKGTTVNVSQMSDEAFYQDFFAKLDRSIENR